MFDPSSSPEPKDSLEKQRKADKTSHWKLEVENIEHFSLKMAWNNETIIQIVAYFFIDLQISDLVSTPLVVQLNKSFII